MPLDNVVLTTTDDLFIPGLVHQVFNKYKRDNGIILTKEERSQLFSELSALLGEGLLQRALHILDEWNFITYYTSDRYRCIVELTSKRNLAQVVRVVPYVNYCKCRYFQRFVLQLKEAGEKENREQNLNSNQVSFTCEHVLAQCLNQLLHPEPRTQILTLDQFRYFQIDIYED
ncbi:hypothetical protein AWZ03_006673 [Drosophila navojoa]|uniref:SWIM-type domain-containing protein n=1 Tax=Drosophila navojoa TaxID=7232 RepID=A0A484BE19_DRONA|nr:uncharacterized protein LOC108659335 isoform X2 [Drosophila navojoa]TDG46969.1 hypothetical protein AWZ03_006673 [Drosophila navojoa]